MDHAHIGIKAGLSILSHYAREAADLGPEAGFGDLPDALQAGGADVFVCGVEKKCRCGDGERRVHRQPGLPGNSYGSGHRGEHGWADRLSVRSSDFPRSSGFGALSAVAAATQAAPEAARQALIARTTGVVALSTREGPPCPARSR